jgi:hypothetical protein
MASSTQKIQQIITSLDNKIIELEKRNTINVTMRIDETIPYLKTLLAIAEDDITTRKFDITTDVTGSVTLTYKANGETISAGSNVLTYGDKLKITATVGTGYDLTSLKVNGVDYVSGTEITVTTDIAVTAVATLQTFNLTTSATGAATITVTRGGDAVTPGTGALTYGDVLTISASADEGYAIDSLTVNGDAFVSGSTLTVSDNVNIVATASAVTPGE